MVNLYELEKPSIGRQVVKKILLLHSKFCVSLWDSFSRKYLGVELSVYNRINDSECALFELANGNDEIDGAPRLRNTVTLSQGTNALFKFALERFRYVRSRVILGSPPPSSKVSTVRNCLTEQRFRWLTARSTPPTWGRGGSGSPAEQHFLQQGALRNFHVAQDALTARKTALQQESHFITFCFSSPTP